MMSISVLLGLFSISWAKDHFSKCGQSLDIAEERIAGVIETSADPVGTWPWMASVGSFQGSEWNHFCGGVIISKRFVLTAAHCVPCDRQLLNQTYFRDQVYIQQPELYIRIGDKDLKSPSDDFGANIREVDVALYHPKYNWTKRSAYYDIALLRALPSITFTSYIRPICMPPFTNELDRYAGDQVTVTGWGFSSRNIPDGGGALRSVPIKIFPQRSCNQTHSKNLFGAQEYEISKHLPQLFTSTVMCAGYERPLYGPCKGDSGSPLVKYQFDPAQYILLGLVQGGIGACGDKDFPAIFTRIESEEIYNFITRETGLSADDPDDDIDESNPVEMPPASNNYSEEVDANGNSHLMVSASRNDYISAWKQLEQGANINHVNNYGQNALMHAAETNGTLRLVNMLLRKGTGINHKDDNGLTALHYAAKVGNLPVAQNLLSKGLFVDSGDKDNVTPLSLAVKAGNYGMVKYLLDQGANIKSRTKKEGVQPIHFPAMGAKVGSVIQLLLAYGADLEAKTNYEATPMFLTFIYGYLRTTQKLHELGAKVEVFNDVRESVLDKAAKHGNLGHIRWLHDLNGGAIFRRLINHPDHVGETPLITATFNNQRLVVRELLSYGSDGSAGKVNINYVNGRGQNALMYAALTNGTARIVGMLLSNGINMHQHDAFDKYALHYAAEYGNLPVLKALLSKGVEIDVRDGDSRTPLSHAVEKGQYGTVKYLLKQGADVNSRSRNSEGQPIHYTAVGPDGSSVIQLLLDYGADLEAETNYKGTPMFLTFVTGYLNTTRQLHKLGAQVEVFNDVRESVLHKAAQFGNVEHMKWLHGLDGGAILKRLLNRPDHVGETPLITAAFNNQAGAVQELLSYGADKTIMDNRGNTALDAAKHYNNNNIVRLLE